MAEETYTEGIFSRWVDETLRMLQQSTVGPERDVPSPGSATSRTKGIQAAVSPTAAGRKTSTIAAGAAENSLCVPPCLGLPHLWGHQHT